MFSGRVVHTTQSSRAVADFATEFFNFATPPTVRLQNRGLNDVYELGGPSRFFLRISRLDRRSLSDTETEAKALVQASATGAPVAVAVRGRNRRFAQRLVTPEGERSVLLFRAAPGTEPQELPEHAYAQGVALAKIHAATLDASTARRMRRLDVESLIRLPIDSAVAELHERPQLASELERVADGTMRHIERLQAELTLASVMAIFMATTPRSQVIRRRYSISTNAAAAGSFTISLPSCGRACWWSRGGRCGGTSWPATTRARH